MIGEEETSSKLVEDITKEQKITNLVELKMKLNNESLEIKKRDLPIQLEETELFT